MPDRMIACPYCNAANRASAQTCTACGAPLELPRAPVSTTPVSTPVATSAPVTPIQAQSALGDDIKESLSSVGSSLGSAGAMAGGLILRTLAEAGAISVAALIIGFGAGSSSNTFAYFLMAVVGGVLVGIAVGLATKRAIFTLFAAPVGALAGLIIARALPVLIPWSALLATAGAMLLALLGSPRAAGSGAMRTYQRLRPWLGALGGLIFGFIGYFIGRLF